MYVDTVFPFLFLWWQVHDFRTIKDTLFTLFRMILGDFNFNEIEQARNDK